MQSSMDKSHKAPEGSPGYETRDTDVRGVLNFLVYLSLMMVFAFLVSWGMFRYLAKERSALAPDSAFAEKRQLPPSPQLQVNPREDLVQFRAEQAQSLESYAWENRASGAVRVPIERAMELLLQKGLPVASEPPPVEAGKPAAKGTAKP